MKICPKCGTRFTDDTLQYCLQDGMPLSDPASRGSFDLDEGETVVRERSSTPRTAGMVPLASPRAGNRSGTAMIVAGTALLTILLLTIGGIAAWMILGNRNPDERGRTGPDNSAATASETPANTPAPPPSPAATPNVNRSNPRPDATGIKNAKREVAESIANWKSATEAKDINSYMAQYADTVEYYNDPSVSREHVRRDKQRAFSVYDTIRMNISNLTTTVDPEENTATTTFDKEWEFEGAGRSKGKVRSVLKLKKIDGRWRIISERDQKVYYVD